MRRFGAYLLASTVVVAFLVAGLWPWLGAAARSGLLTAGTIAVAAQAGAFALLLRAGDAPNGFLAAFAGGVMARLVLVGVAGAIATTFASKTRATALVLGLVGFFFVLVLLEAGFLAGRKNRNERTT